MAKINKDLSGIPGPSKVKGGGVAGGGKDAKGRGKENKSGDKGKGKSAPMKRKKKAVDPTTKDLFKGTLNHSFVHRKSPDVDICRRLR
jgi:hypothetical protein